MIAGFVDPTDSSSYTNGASHGQKVRAQFRGAAAAVEINSVWLGNRHLIHRMIVVA
jgi:hypothetical protein